MQTSAWALLLLLAIPASAADDAAKGWDRTGQLSSNQSVTIHLFGGKTLKGKIQAAGADGLTLIRDGAATEVKRADIAKITRKSRAKGALWGFIAGAAIASPIIAAKAGYLVDKNNPSAADRLGMAAIGAMLFGGPAAGVGAAVGASNVIYKAAAGVPDNAGLAAAKARGAAQIE